MLETFTAVLCHFGRLENHSISLAPAFSQRAAAEIAAEKLRAVCSDVSVLALEFEGDGRWPQSPNMHWALTMNALRAEGNTQPAFWMELDCTPMVPDWADQLDYAWRSGRKAFCGRVSPKPTTRANGSIIYEPDDLFMMGCAIYPHNMMSHMHIDAMFKGFYAGTNPEAWDFYLRGWMRQIGWSHTDLIADRWNTVNYRLEDGELKCDAAPSTVKHQDYHTVEVTGAAVIHGCKGGSLAQLILDGTLEGQRGREIDRAAVSIPLNRPPVPSATSVTPSSASGNQAPPTQELFGRVAQVESRLARLEGLAFGTKVITVTGASNGATELTPAPDHITRPPVIEIEAIRGMVSAKAIRIAELQKVFKTTNRKLVKVINAPDSRLVLARGWVKLAP